ncbi:protein FAR1-RELATED SEQUENCE 5 [Dendrobium catenatum]|uniref:Protein FAR1-RELATED SEQUENCE n=1 Tax=Dendrobium catenatum TaxID=906689 RepID=A0A2I0W5A6_9ASPA|nr:protein FAR1-RELATED SEQUENCE 5 [Dendrobium catenatum]XP_028554301.1 protein FAR1-RELATED SEQUENCE 5 [Dendrobium catenatum]XP_028554302.1 protein FAR1-RELATED SEQUENCE 5 [Dendrobium catenatum]XP_028554303.1 protein FAR1-RELATED SEQUENCE 5 [Dendrobium catenatum]PKU70840.1 Protein FAR1-RELATED SEQUENCE 5 [Dendrobium catenatum]
MSETVEESRSSSCAGTVEDSWVPKLDMVFESDEKAYQFYCLYAREIGFGVRKNVVKRRANNTVYARGFCCYKEGFCRTTKEGKKPRPDVRTGCCAHIIVRLLDDGKFHVTEFEAEHNHELVGKNQETQMESSNGVGAMAKVGRRNLGRQFTRKSILSSFMPSKCVDPSKLGSDKSLVPVEGVDNENWLPKIDMEFEDDDEAYEFYVNYAARTGFSVRKNQLRRRTSGLVYSRTYSCHKEGQSRKITEHEKRGDKLVRGPKPYERTGCLASMTIKIMKNGRYRVVEFEPKHNHPLVIPSKLHLFRWRWQRELIGTQANLMESGDDNGKPLEPFDGKKDDQDGSDTSFPLISLDCRNYIQSKRAYEALPGDVGALMQYVQEKQVEDPSFYYALQLDRNDKVASIFWADAKSMFEFECFGDVLCFDTTYKYRDYGRPFSPFLGVNNHKQTVIFGAALLYDETKESFVWLFETFKTAMSGKKPHVVFTDRCEDMNNAIAAVWPGTIHRVCAWHIYNDAMKHLNHVFQGSTTFAKDFSQCLYDIEDEEDFTSRWEVLLEKYDLGNNSWLAELYEDREKWSLAYGRQTFCADINSTLTKDTMGSRLKNELDLDLNLLDFFKYFESMLNEKRNAELQADYRGCHSAVKMPASKMLRQAANVYTPAVFKTFQNEFELSMDMMVYLSGQVQTTYIYKVTIEDSPKEYIVRFDSFDNTCICSCKKFDCIGIQCRHVMKVLDIINIKELPPQYLLKRWRKDAKSKNLVGIQEIELENENTLGERYSHLRGICNRIAVRAAETVDSYAFIETLSSEVLDQVYKIMKGKPPERH